MWRSFLAVFRKEFLHILRDAGTLRLALMLPVMQLVLFGFIDQTVHDLPTAIVDQDHSVDSRLFRDQLRATKTFKIIDVTTDPEQARQEIRSGRARIAIVIPPRFHDDRVRGTTAQVLVLIDGSDSTASAQALASVNGLIASDNLARLETVVPGQGAIAAQPIILFNPEGRTANYIIPGLVAVLLQLVGHRALRGGHRARARAGNPRAAPGHPDRSHRPDDGEALPLPRAEPRRDDPDPDRDALRVRRSHSRAASSSSMASPSST